MNRVLRFISTIVSIIVLSLMFVLYVYNTSISPNNVLRVMDKIDYYDMVYDNILDEFDNGIINVSLKEDIKSYYSIDVLRNDILDLVKGNTADHSEQFKEIVSKYTKDKDIVNNYIVNINKVIDKNIFITNEYILINKTYISINDMLFIEFILFIVMIGILFVNYILFRDIGYIKDVIISFSLLMIIPKIFIYLSGIFNNFYYNNEYYSKLLLNIVSNIENRLFMIGLIGLIIVIFYKISKKSEKMFAFFKKM